MDIELLRTFLEVSRTRHFGKAAENLFLTQSAVSARIRLLEDTLGVALFDRQRNNIQPTPAGLRLTRHAEGIVHLWSRARQQVAMPDASTTALSVSGVPSLWDILLTGWLARSIAARPDLMLLAEVQSADDQLRKLRDGSLDLAFSFETTTPPGMVLRRIASVPLVLVSGTVGRDAEAALGEGYILVDWGTSFASAHAQHFSDMAPPTLRVGLGRLAHALLLARGGAAFLAEPTIGEDLASGRLHRVAGAPVIQRDAYALYGQDGEHRAVIEALLPLLEEAGAPQSS